jgi:hypothetical protein
MRRLAATLAPIVLAVAVAAATPAAAEVAAAAPDHMTLTHTVVSPLPAAAAWRRLTRVQDWWNGSHTYSGDARNLRLDLKPGGCWCERWADGVVVHGRVVQALTGKMLRIDGAFGPLQGLAAIGMMSFTLEPGATPDTTRVSVTYVVNGSSASKLDRLAPVVDRVLGEQMARLAGG